MRAGAFASARATTSARAVCSRERAQIMDQIFANKMSNNYQIIRTDAMNLNDGSHNERLNDSNIHMVKKRNLK